MIGHMVEMYIELLKSPLIWLGILVAIAMIAVGDRI